MAHTFRNLGFETAGITPGLANGWEVDQLASVELFAEFGLGGEIQGTVDDFERGWTNNPVDDFKTVFIGKLIDLFPAIFNLTNDDEETFEREWSAVEFFITAHGSVDSAMFDAGTPQTFEDFEEEWDTNESNIAVFVGPGTDLTLGLFDSTTPENFEDFEDEWNGHETVHGQQDTLFPEETVSMQFVTGPDRIERATGSWLTLGVVPGMALKVSGTISNNVLYTVAQVNPLTITLIVADTVINEGPVSSEITNLQFINFDAIGVEAFESTWTAMTTF